MRHRRWFTSWALLCVAGGCGSGVTASTSRGDVLFIGNSYLFWQDIPGIVQAMAVATGEELRTASVAGPDMALYDHLSQGAALRTITRGGWKYVVLQQGPSSVSYNRDSLRAATKLFDNIIRQQGGRTALFSAWPQQSRRQDFPRAIESYELAAADVNGIYIPVAAAWIRAWELDPSLALYADGLHPSPAGAYLSALVVYSTLTGKSPRNLPWQIGGVSLDENTAAILQIAAAQVTGH